MNRRILCMLPILAVLGLALRLPAANATPPAEVKVALYAGGGTSASKENVKRALASEPRLKVTELNEADVQAGKLAGFDVVICPGGTGGGQAKALGEKGREAIKSFVSDGGGYVGICAGAYLATCDYSWSLGILDAKVIDREHWARGYGPVAVNLTDAGRKTLDESAEQLTIYYHQGPLLAPAHNPNIEDFQPLAIYDGEIAKNGAPKGVMPGTCAVAAGRHGAGQVFCFSCHPEKTTEHERLIVKAVVQAAEKLPPAPVTNAEQWGDGFRVAIYDHSTGDAKAPGSLKKILTPEAGFACRVFRPADIQNGLLEQENVDVLIMPGGSGSKQAANLGVVGRENIRRFVRNGGGYVGICAGSYLATTHYTWSLHLLNAIVVDREHWARGTGTVQIGFTDGGRDALQCVLPSCSVYYGQGPLLAPGGVPNVPVYEPLAEYQSEIAEKGAPSGVMVGTTAIARAPFGAGRVICFSPHPESAGGPNELILQGVRWAAAAGETAE